MVSCQSMATITDWLTRCRGRAKFDALKMRVSLRLVSVARLALWRMLLELFTL